MLKTSANEFLPTHQFNGIDIVKFIGAFCICIIHIQPFQSEVLGLNLNYWLQSCFCRIAVPFYFAAAGFLLFRKTDFNRLNTDRIRGYCFKILRLLGIWTFLLFVGPKEWVHAHLWYMGALALAVIVLSVLIYKGIPLHTIIIISVILYCIGLIGDSYYGFIEPLKAYSFPNALIEGYETVFATTRNGIFLGLLFVLIGALFAQKRIVMNNIVAFIGLLVSLVMMVFEIYMLKHFSNPKDANMSISLVFVIFFLFYLSVHVNLKNRPIYGSLRVIGMLFFYTHQIVSFVVWSTIEAANKNSSIQLILTIILTLLLATLIERLSKTKKCQWLKYLYS